MPNFPLLHNKFRITGIITIAVTVMVYLCFEVTNEWKLNIPVIAYEEPFGPKNYFSVVSVPVYDTIICICLLLGLLFVAFAKLKKEDEYVVSIRLSSWLWAVWINSILLLASFIFFYGISFLQSWF